ncbi:MAG: DUF1801 domain-containing protein [Paludibacter sp.]
MENTTPKPVIKTVDEYIASQPEVYRKSLEQLRRLIRTLAPEAKESISYGIACYSYHYMFVGFSAHKNHFSFTSMSSTMLKKFENELEGFDTSMGGIRFKPGQEIPVELITRIILERKAENELRSIMKKKKKL